jgi:hypothetical protein
LARLKNDREMVRKKAAVVKRETVSFKKQAFQIFFEKSGL